MQHEHVFVLYLRAHAAPARRVELPDGVLAGLEGLIPFGPAFA